MKRHQGLLLFSVWISNLGNWIYHIALNLIVLNMTGSPFAVSILYILPYLASLVTNTWAGSFIDRVNQKSLLIGLDVFRAILVLSLVQTSSIITIYCISFVIQMLNSIFSTTSFVYMTKLIPDNELQRFNSWKSFVQSSGFFLGPSIAGLLFIIGTPTTAIIVNSMALLGSALIIAFLKNVESGNPKLSKITFSMIKEDWRSVYQLSRKNTFLSTIYLLSSSATVLMATLDSLEAAFSLNVLHLSESTYGLLVSVAGVGVIVGSYINAKCSSRWTPLSLLKHGTIFTSIGYVIYSLSNGFVLAGLGFFILTFSYTFVSVGFLTYIQQELPTNVLGRFSSLFSVYESLIGMVGILLVGVLSEIFNLRSIVLSVSILFFVLGIFNFIKISNRLKVEKKIMLYEKRMDVTE